MKGASTPPAHAVPARDIEFIYDMPNDEYSANYLISNAVNIYCPAQLCQLRNSAGGYVPPPQ
jgi:hypothetical protein